MPPFVGRKRRESPSPPPPPKRIKKEEPLKKSQAPRAGKNKPSRPKSGVFDLVDSPKSSSNVKPQQGKIFVNVAESDSSKSSDVDSDEFEDVVHEKEETVPAHESGAEEDKNWEDALHQGAPDRPEGSVEDAPTEALELTLSKTQPSLSYVDLTGKKSGPSRNDRRKRDLAHRIHVQYLMWHNYLRNHWLNDKEVQKTMVAHLEQSQKMKLQIETWRRRSGISNGPSTTKPSPKGKGKAKTKAKGRKTEEDDDLRSKRDWADPAERQAVGQPDVSRGDPILPLLNTTAAWWRQRFTVTAPCLRKRGYRPMKDVKEEVTAWRKDESEITDHGERVTDIKEFRSCAKRCEGSRDIGAQLFVALLRGLGIEARMVASLQPLGFGWTKFEEAEAREERTSNETPKVNGSSSSSKGGRAKSKQVSGKTKSKPASIELSDTSDLSGVDSTDYDSDVSIVDITPKRKANKLYDGDMLFPTYWIEAASSVTRRVFPVDPFFLKPSVATSAEHLALFEPRGAKAERARQVFAYVVAFSPDNTAKDVTTRYLKKHVWPGKTKGFRMPPDKLPVANEYGKVVAYYEIDWWGSVMRSYQRPADQKTKVDEVEDEAELRPVKPEKKGPKEGDPDTLDGYKRSEKFVLERHLRREEALLPGARSVKTFKTGKGEKSKDEPVYLRKDVVVCRTSESWHKEGRQIRTGEQPLKMVPVRAVTLTRKREIEEAERETGEKATQGMYGKHQTDWIIPPPIENGVIPKNGYGNMDAFVPQMIPRGAIHLPMRGTKQVCKKLEIDYAEAVTGFEFGNKMAVPVIEGVVVAEENRDLVIDAWNKAEEERKIKEEVKREKAILSTWRKFLMGLRVLERMRAEYEIDVDDDVKERNPFTNRKKEQPVAESSTEKGNEPSKLDVTDIYTNGGGFLPDDDEAQAGGFIPEGREEELPSSPGRRRSELEGNHQIAIEHEDNPRKIAIAQRGKAMSLAELAAQREPDGADKSEEPDTATATQEQTKSRGPKAGKQKPRSNGRGRPSKTQNSTQAEKRDEDHDPGTSSGVSSDLEPKTPLRQSQRSTRASTRSSAKASKSKIRSHYFRHDSSTESEDSEEDFDDTQRRASGRKKGGRKR